MEECLGEMDCKNRSDSIMMRLLRSAMDKAYRKVQSKDGPIECLHQRSKFYEFAIIQIEGSLRMIQEETEATKIPEINRENMISGLIELKCSLESRLKAIKASIINKDREFIELKQALEFKEKELFSLKNNEHKDGDICMLKNSVDQQVLNIKQKLECERMNPWSLSRRLSSNFDEFEFDIDNLKGGLDRAFDRMQNIEARPLEKEWKWAIEKECLLILVKGFILDLNENFQEKLVISSNSLVHESLLREDVFEVIIRQSVMQWKENVEIYVAESRLKEELTSSVFDETIKHIKRIVNLEMNKAWKFGREACDFTYSDFVKFDNVLFDFEQKIQNRLLHNYSRIEVAKIQLDSIAQSASSLKKREAIFRNAFLTRSHNLQLAEAEVDILGDQANALLKLLENIYLKLDQNSKALSEYFGVFDILKLIRKEVENGAGMDCA